MKPEGLQAIGNKYFKKGYKGKKLKEVLKRDKKFKRLLKKKKGLLTKKIKITKKEKSDYILSTNEDYLILSKIKELEKKRLRKADAEIIKLIRTQLRHDWRTPLVNHLNKLSKKYKK